MLLGAGVFGALAILPYALTLQGGSLKGHPIPLLAVLLRSTLQSTVLLGIAIFIGLWLGKKVGLGAPILEDWLAKRPVKEKLKSVSILSIKLGALAGVLIIGFDFVFSLFMKPITAIRPPLWQGFLASFYGGIVEEILMRLFLVTFFVWIFRKLARSNDGEAASKCVWGAIMITAVIFGIGHLPSTSSLTALTPLIVFRAILLNGIGGVVFGWLYWKKGLASAMIAHFSGDIALHVVRPLFLA